MRRRSAFWLWMAALGAIVAVGAVTGVVLVAGTSSSPSADDAADRYLAAWQARDWQAMRGLVHAPPPELETTYAAMGRDLGVTGARYERRSTEQRDTGATVTFRASLTLRSVGNLAYDGSLHLVREQKQWKVQWTAAAVHPQLTDGARFAVARVVPERAPVLAADGAPLTTNTTTVEIGLEPRRIKDRRTLLTVLQRATGVSPESVASKLDAAGVRPDVFVPVVTVGEDQYQVVRDDLYPIPGVIFRRNPARVAATLELAQHVVGTVGPITAELLRSLGAPYSAGDSVGLRGLERTYERRLAGTPDVVAQILPSDGSSPVVLAKKAGIPPQPVRTSIDLRVQRAAEASLDRVTMPAAVVATRPSTGQVLAVVSTPVATEFNRALQGQYPPGSTFKIITSAAVLGAGARPDTTTTCPASLTVDGRSFRNFEGEAASRLSFENAFAESCNTAFIQLGATVPGANLVETARRFGFGSTLNLGIASASGNVPLPATPVEHAEAVIGQGRVVASPLQMTTLAAAVADGTWRSPTLVLDPPPRAPRATSPLAPQVTDALRTFMRRVVSNGTGTAASARGEPPVSGKTGTAEFGTAVPPRTHAWFVGYRGDLAFGVLVEDGGVGGRVAAPIAARFLDAL
jgi:cell division protein FtsI/penicillin-binding protein 2